jgi:2-oxoglutarate ferredoxin oxidoreductase subunit alpha
MKIASEMMPGPKFIGPKDAKTTIVTWGSGKLPACQAMMDNNPAKQDLALPDKQLTTNNAINVLHFSYMWPMNVKAVNEALKNCAPSTLLIEQNATGQFQSLLKEQTGWEPSAYLRKYDGRPFYAEEIVEKLNELTHKRMNA